MGTGVPVLTEIEGFDSQWCRSRSFSAGHFTRLVYLPHQGTKDDCRPGPSPTKTTILPVGPSLQGSNWVHPSGTGEGGTVRLFQPGNREYRSTYHDSHLPLV